MNRLNIGETREGKNGDCDEISPEIYVHFLQRHEGVLRDEVTMGGFKAAMEANGELFQGATVLEVNCGSGMLSMWAAQMGAARVIAVERSEVWQVARELVRHNQLEHVVEVWHGTVAQLQLPPVDIILSKWMGACLMYNSSLEDVLCARDKCLKPGGCIFPAIANLYIAAAEQPRNPLHLLSSSRQYWTRHHGLNLSLAWTVKQQTPLVSFVDVNHVLTQRQLLQHFDMHTLQQEQLSFTVPFKLRCLRQSLAKIFVLYFDFRFPGSSGAIKISSSPSAPATQWKQTLFRIDKHLPLCVNDSICGEFRVQRSAQHLDFDIDWSCHNKLTDIEWHKQIYRMQGEAVSI